MTDDLPTPPPTHSPTPTRAGGKIIGLLLGQPGGHGELIRNPTGLKGRYFVLDCEQAAVLMAELAQFLEAP